MPLFTQRSEIKATKTLIRKTYGMSLWLAIHSGSKAAYLHHFPFQWVRNFMSPLEDDFSGEGQYQKLEIMDSIVAFRQKMPKRVWISLFAIKLTWFEGMRFSFLQAYWDL